MIRRRLVLVLLVLLAFLFAAAHAKVYLRTPGDPELIECKLDSLTPAILAERQPVLVGSRVVRLDDLVPTVFRWQLTCVWGGASSRTRTRIVEARRRVEATARFNVFSCRSGDAVARIGLVSRERRAAAAEEVPAAVVHLAENEVIVLPPHWWFECDATVSWLALHDTPSLILSRAL